jgi:hypothetical protein
MDATRNLIDYAMDSNGVEFRNQLYASIHDRVTAAIEAKKQELAGSLIRQEAKEEDDEDAGHENAEKKMMKSLDKNKDGKHTKADHKMEEVELDEGTMTHITLGKKVKNDDGGHDQTVHYKGKKIGKIGSYPHESGRTKYYHEHPEIGYTVGHRSPEEAIDELRADHAEHLRDTKVKNEEVEGKDEKSEKEEPKKPNAFTMKSKSPSEFAKSSSGGKTKETKTGRTHSSGDRY